MNKKTPENTEIKDPTAIKWYKEGFRFAINYIYAILPESNNNSLTKDTFKEFLGNKLDEGVNPKYFEDHLFSCPPGFCPGDTPGSCIQCPDKAIVPL